MFLLNRWRVYAGWPYLAGDRRAVADRCTWPGSTARWRASCWPPFLPTRPTPAAGPLLAQAATALAELEQAERAVRRAGGEVSSVEQEPIWDWASRNLSAAAARLLSPAERVERELAPWSTYVVLPLFAFTAAGVPLAADLGAPGAWRVLAGVVLGLAIGKPLGIVAATWLGGESADRHRPGGRRVRRSSARPACAASATRSRSCWPTRRSPATALPPSPSLGCWRARLSRPGLACWR